MVALQVLRKGFHLDDIVLLRLDHIKNVKFHPNRDFVSRVVAALGVPIKEFERAPDGTTSDLLRTVAERAELVCLYQESREFHWFQIGMIQKVGSKRLEMHGIEDDGTWYENSGLRSLKRITRVEFGGRGVAALERFGEEMPPASAESTRRMKACRRSELGAWAP